MAMLSKKLAVILAATGLLFVIVNLVKPSAPDIKQNSYLEIGGVKLEIEIADTATARAQGLSGRPILPENTGMLFVFNTADYYNFWMKDMYFPIDIIWLNDDWRVIDLTENISPKNFPVTYQPRAPARYVLEVNAGFTTTHHLTIGTRVVSR